jgi:hypothetical protein
MQRNVLILAAAALVAGTVATAAQQQLPQEPRGEESTRSATPRGEQSGPDQTRGQAPRGPGSATQQSTPQEPRGEESTQSATPRGQEPGPNPGQPRR